MIMSSQVCPECGREFAAGAPAGMCPNCLLRLGLRAAADDARELDATSQPSASVINRSFGDYELLEEVARGGMGVVFRARQLSLNRTVAVKLVHGGVFATPSHIKRFKLEAETAARLHHPNIVSIYEVGEHDGQPFFSMTLVEGGTLLDAMKRRPFTPREAAEMMKTIASAVHFAHQRGVLHRDLKPTNILMDAEGGPHITDFGLAKLLEDESDLTLTLAVMGTPAYMSPEQAAGKTKDLTTSADIYSLGVILYELLSGQPPFAARTTAAVLRQVVEAEPPSLRKRNPAVDADLETICLKCLEKDPACRYGSAAELADELERWRAGRPILARPISTTERLCRWARRNPVLATVSTALLLSLLIGGFMLDRAYRGTRAALYDSLLTQARAQLQSKQMGQRFEVLAALQQAAAIRNTIEVRSEAAAALAKPDARLLARWPDRVRSGNLRNTFAPDLESYIAPMISGGCELRATKDHSLLRYFPQVPKASTKTTRQLEFVRFSRDGRRFAVQYNDRQLDVWDRDMPEPLLKLDRHDGHTRVLDFAPDGQLVVIAAANGIFAHSLADGSRRALLPQGSDVSFVRFDPAGERLALVRTNALEIWTFPEAKRVWSVPAESYVNWAAWSPDGRLVAAANPVGRDVQLFDAATGTLVTRFAGHSSTPFLFEFHPANQWVASTARDSTVQAWDRRNGQVVFKTVTDSWQTLQFSQNGNRVATGAGEDQIGISEFHLPAVFREYQSTSEGEPNASGIDSSADGRFVVTASVRDIRLWDVQKQLEILVLPTAVPTRVFFGPNDDEIIYGRGGVGTFRQALVRARDESGNATITGIGPRQRTPVPPKGILISVGQDRQSWLLRGHQKNPEIWRDGKPELAKKLPPDRGQLSISPDARWMATTPQPPTVMEVWDTASRRKIFTNKDHRIWATSFSPEGKWLVGSGADGHHVWETGTWKHTFHFQYEGSGNATFAQGGRLMALSHGFGEVDLLEMPQARKLIHLKPPLNVQAFFIKLSEDGNRLWLVGQGHRLFEWDLTALRQELAKLGLDWQD